MFKLRLWSHCFTYLWVFETREQAMEEVMKHVDEWFPNNDPPENPKERRKAYFAENDDEHYRISEYAFGELVANFNNDNC